MSSAAIRRMGLPHRQKKNPYSLVTISGDPILYGNSIIHFKTGPVKIEIKGQKVVVSFNILLLGKDKAVLKISFLQKFNPKIDWESWGGKRSGTGGDSASTKLCRYYTFLVGIPARLLAKANCVHFLH